MKLLAAVSLLLSLACQAHAYNVLVTVMGLSGSHNVLMYRFGELLADAGHNVTMLAGNVIGAKPPPPKHIKQEIKYDALPPEEQKVYAEAMGSAMSWNSAPGLQALPQAMKLISNLVNTCDNLLDNQAVMNTLKASSFDVIVVHQFDVCSIGLIHILGIKGSIQFAAGLMLDHHIWWSGAPFPVAAVPAGTNNVLDNMGFADRFKNTLIWAVANGFVNGVGLPAYTRRFRERYGEDFPSLNDIAHDFDLFFCNSDNLVDFPRPTMPNTIEVAGFMMGEPTANDLSEEWKSIVEDDVTNKQGFILFSMGSVVDTKNMPRDITV